MIRYDQFGMPMAEGGGYYPAGTNELVPGKQSTWKGDLGQGLQFASAGLTGFAAIKEASQAKRDASKEFSLTTASIYQNYANAFESLREHNRRMFAAQDVAVGTSGLAASGSIMRVLDETISMARKSRSNMQKSMQAEIDRAAYIKKMKKKAASRAKKYGLISAGLQLGMAAFGGPA